MRERDIVDRLDEIRHNPSDWDHPINGRATLAEAADEIKRLRAVVPVDAEGKLFNPSQSYFVRWYGNKPYEIKGWPREEQRIQLVNSCWMLFGPEPNEGKKYGFYWPLHHCYSTREAAEQAGKETNS